MPKFPGEEPIKQGQNARAWIPWHSGPVGGPEKLLTDEPFAHGIKDQLSWIVQVQFLENVTAVRLDGVGADIESCCHFLVGFPFGEKLQDFSLATG